jgi:hypothetical protein
MKPLLQSLVKLFQPIQYRPVEHYANTAGCDIDELKETTTRVLQNYGKVEAIVHVNRELNGGKPLPLPSTMKFVDALELKS